MAIPSGRDHVEAANLDVLVDGPRAYGVSGRLGHVEYGERWPILNSVQRCGCLAAVGGLPVVRGWCLHANDLAAVWVQSRHGDLVTLILSHVIFGRLGVDGKSVFLRGLLRSVGDSFDVS